MKLLFSRQFRQNPPGRDRRTYVIDPEANRSLSRTLWGRARLQGSSENRQDLVIFLQVQIGALFFKMKQARPNGVEAGSDSG